jgi:hypothetical protein
MESPVTQLTPEPSKPVQRKPLKHKKSIRSVLDGIGLRILWLFLALPVIGLGVFTGIAGFIGFFRENISVGVLIGVLSVGLPFIHGGIITIIYRVIRDDFDLFTGWVMIDMGMLFIGCGIGNFFLGADISWLSIFFYLLGGLLFLGPGIFMVYTSSPKDD